MKKHISIRQHDMTDCGAACLASIAEYWGSKYAISKIRQLASTDKNGTNLAGLIDAADKLGFIAKAVRCRTEDLRNIPVPAIGHVRLKNGLLHYMVIYKAGKRLFLIMDPAEGEVLKMSIGDFSSIWTGILILITPGEKFKKGNFRISVFSRFVQLIQPHSRLFIQSFFGAGFYSLLGLSVSVYVQKIVDNILPEQNTSLLNLLSIIMIIFLGFRTYIGTIKSLYLLKSGRNIDRTLIMGYYWHLLRLPARFFDTMRTGELISRVNDAVKIRIFLSNTIIDLIVSAFIILLSVCFSFIISVKTALLLGIIVPLFIMIYWIFNKINKRILRGVMEKSADLESQLVESLNNVSTIRYLNMEMSAYNKTESTFFHFIESTYTAGRHSIFANNGASLLTGIATIILLWFGSYSVFSQDITPGELMLLYSLFGYLLGPLANLVMMNRTIQDALIASDRLFQILDMEHEKNGSDYLLLDVRNICHDIKFENVYFGYGNRTDIIRDMNFYIRQGDITGIAGESGCGKSTIAALLMKIYPVRSGKIMIGNYDTRDVHPSSLRKIVGIVPQRIDLFSGNIIDNIAFDSRQEDIIKVMKVCEMTGLSTLINSLPNGLYTQIGERGISLSGGEIQRIAISRMLYRDPSIIIMDEATSALDLNAERMIQNLILSLKEEGKTVIIITHKLQCMMIADKIFFIENHTLVESGTHHELLNMKGSYFRLWKNQFNNFLIE